MIKRLILVFSLSFISISSVFSVQNISNPVGHAVYGSVGSALNFTVDIDSTILPFNLEDPIVAKNSTPGIVAGLPIGKINFHTNDDTFNIKVSPGTLQLSTQKVPGEELKTTEISYRLDLILLAEGITPQVPSNGQFASVISGESIIINKNNFPIGDYRISNRNLYISMNADTSAISNLATGIYTSDIIFDITMNN